MEEGENKKEIYDRLSAKYYDSDTIAKLIASFPDPALKSEYGSMNSILAFLLFLTGLLKVLGLLPLIVDKPAIGLVMVLIVPILNIVFAIEVMKTRGYVYRIIGFLAIFSIFKSLRNIDEIGLWVLLDFGLAIAIAGLSFYVGSKMFPNYGFGGPKKDIEGNWEL